MKLSNFTARKASGRLALSLALALGWASAQAQNYSLVSGRIAGGGGTSSNTNTLLSVTGTIGQAEAGGQMSGGNYSVTGGFWSIYAVQMPGLPRLVVVRNGASSVKIMWPATGSYTLQQNSSVANAAGWVASSFTNTLSTANGTNTVTITPPSGNLFFRLTQ